MIASAPWAGALGSSGNLALLTGAILVLRNQISADAGTNLVSQWTDESGFNHHALPVTGKPRPTSTGTNTNGNKDVLFSGTQGLRIPSFVIPAGTQDLTVFYGYEKTISGSQPTCLMELSLDNGSNTTSFYLGGHGLIYAGLLGNVGVSSESTNASVGTTPPQAMRTELFKSRSTGEVRILRDGSPVSGTVLNANNTNAFATNPLNVGTNGSFSAPLYGKLSSVIIFPFQVTGQQALDIEAFFINSNS